jgi:hypothetical protein
MDSKIMRAPAVFVSNPDAFLLKFERRSIDPAAEF